ncbi:hypothetical protein [Aliiglaciecola lipolytica]|uniref:Lipoprotein n=1 Tax=Aliiglaciecola lipolytica E3 TaxID=1127673 RepID=K6X435_9ALTE|nr:hypothetical protein [Aliiglaciecola lipolytica]GAC15379.1 hypothetical protein GLIP_2758 [Aliiglaciecola lipolytica E3]
MEIKNIFKVSAIATALVLAGCGGDINISEGDIDNSSTVNNPPTTTPTPTPTPTDDAPGESSTFLSGTVSDALGEAVEVRTLSGRLTDADEGDNGKITLTNDIVWALEGAVFVGSDNADSTVLEIEEGTIIFGRNGSDYLVISRGSQIEAMGSSTDPIIMTSYNDVIGDEVGAGQWGGLVLLGNAPSNKCPADADCALQVEGVEEGAVFGGDAEDDNSGILNYLVVKYAGFEVAPDNELNGITFGGVGSATEVDYIQVHANADDGVEFFGGNVQAKHLVLTSNQDDSVDWDNGFRGKLQYVYIEQDKANGDANRGIEADNDGSTPDLEPQSNPLISNITIIGNDFDGEDDSEGVYLREGTGAQIYNMVITGSNGMGECLEVEGVLESQTNLSDGTITIENSVMACTNGENFKNGSLPEGASHTIVDLETWFLEEGRNNRVSESVMLNSDGTPMTGSLLLEGAADASQVDGFFDATSFVGAVTSDDDWRQGWAFGFGGGTVKVTQSASGCPAGTTTIAAADGVTNTCEISGRITSDLTLTEGNLYALSGAVFVGGDNENSATLEIEAGVTLFGRSGNDYLVVSRGSQIEALGTATDPITMTSAAAVTGGLESGAAGQWGGLVLLGNAPSNKCPVNADCALQVEGVQEGAVFGGTESDDNSGTLRYVRVMHGGFEVAPDNELNGVTFGGVGSGTTVEYLQVHKNADDGVEFFGGSVDVKYLVLTGIQDDAIDWDNGFTGRIQYALIKAAADNSDANRAFESDNDGSTPDITPQSNPTVANVTIIGNDFDGEDDSEGVYLREGSGAQLSNFIITGSAGMGECFEVEGVLESQTNLGDGTITFTNSVIACENGENFKDGALPEGATHTIVDLEDWFLNTQTGNAVAANQAAVLDGIFSISDVTPKDFSGDTFFDNADFVGAVKADADWTAGWTVGLE